VSRRKRLFSAPGRATAWGVAGCLACYVAAGAGFVAVLVVTVVAALAGCVNR
jgi:hypothetical protein